MSDLQEFISEQKAKNSLFGSASASASFSSINSIRSKITSGLNGFPFKKSADSDAKALIDSDEQTNGQLSQSRNRKNNRWFNFISSEESIFGLSRMQRIVAFFMSIGAAFICFGMAVVLLPTLFMQARKFAALNSLGSVMLILSFAFLWGPVNYLKHMFSEQRRHVTAIYLTTVAATLYFSLWLRSPLITILCATFQAVALLWYLFSYVPGGERGLRFLVSLLKGFYTTKSTTVLPI